MPSRSWPVRGLGAMLLAGPTALAFFTGGYFTTARDGAGLIAWALVALALLVGPPAGRSLDTAGRRLAVAGLAALSAWTLLSLLWAPVAGSAFAAGQIAVLYLGGLLAAWLLLGERGLRTAVEPAVAAGALIVIGYGLSERLLPDLLHFSQSASADGRLEQPLTYWNAMGILAALGLVLCVRLAGDAGRPLRLRATACSGAAVLGMGLYLSFSRGALFAAAAGLVGLAILSPDRAQLAGGTVALTAAVLGAVLAAPFGDVAHLGTGTLSGRELQGAVVLVGLVLIMALAAATLGQLAVRGRLAPVPLRLPRHPGVIAVAVICVGFALAVAFGAHERSGVPLAGGATRLGTLQSNRYDYWSVALKAFAHDPVIGVGAGGWAVWWLRDRPYADGAVDAHSLELQTLAELGIVGAGLLLAVLVGVGLAARDAVRRVPQAAAGPVAGCIVYLAHSPLDWDWQMPAVTLVAVLLAGSVLALGERSGDFPGLSSRRAG